MAYSRFRRQEMAVCTIETVDKRGDMYEKKYIENPAKRRNRVTAVRKKASAGAGLQKNRDVAFEVLASLWAVAHGMETLSKFMQKRMGLTGSQRFVIRIIGTRPRISAAELASELHLDPSTLTGILRRLDAQGLITRKSAADDARRAVLTLTGPGRRINGATEGTIEAAVATALADVTEDHIRLTQLVLERISRELERSTKCMPAD